MKYCCGILILFFFAAIPIAACAQQGNWLWTKSAGGLKADQATSVALDGAGNVYVAGSYQDSAIFSGVSVKSSRGSHFFIAKYSSDGSLLWVKSSGREGLSFATGIVCGADNYFYVTGYFFDSLIIGAETFVSAGNDDLFLAKYDLDGNPVWAKQGGGGSYDQASAVAIDNAGDIFVTGNFSGTADFGGKKLVAAGSRDIFFASL